jgi:hypothetical protein
MSMKIRQRFRVTDEIRVEDRWRSVRERGATRVYKP